MDQILNNNTSKDYPQLKEYYKRIGPPNQQVNTAQNILQTQTLPLKIETQHIQQQPQGQQQQRTINTYDKVSYDNSYERNVDRGNYGREIPVNIDDYKPSNSAERCVSKS